MMVEKNKSLHENLVELQHLLKTPKSNYNEFGGYYSRSAEDILEAVKPLLFERGLTLTTPVRVESVVALSDSYWVYQVCDATLSNGKESIVVPGNARETWERKKMDSSQLSGAASSYAKKYALGNLFALDDTKDADSLEPEDAPKKVSLQPVGKPADKELSDVQGPCSLEALEAILIEVKKLDSEQRDQFKSWLKEQNLSFGKEKQGKLVDWTIGYEHLARLMGKISELKDPLEADNG